MYYVFPVNLLIFIYMPLSQSQKAKRYRAKRSLDAPRLALYNAGKRRRYANSHQSHGVKFMLWAVRYLTVVNNIALHNRKTAD